VGLALPGLGCERSSQAFLNLRHLCNLWIYGYGENTHTWRSLQCRTSLHEIARPRWPLGCHRIEPRWTLQRASLFFSDPVFRGRGATGRAVARVVAFGYMTGLFGCLLAHEAAAEGRSGAWSGNGAINPLSPQS